MKAIAVNESLRRNCNTDVLLQIVLDGANSIGVETELIHLCDLQFRGCTSCLSFKEKTLSFLDIVI